MSYLGTLRVASAGESRPANIVSSNPTTAMASGPFKLHPAQVFEAMESLLTLSRSLSRSLPLTRTVS